MKIKILLAGLSGLAVTAHGWALEEAVLPQDTWPDVSARSLALILLTGSAAWLLATIIRHRYWIVKRTIDVVGATIGLVVTAPVLAAAVVAIRTTSRGPAVFTQERLGRHGKPFRMYKLRTMAVDAERQTGPVWAAADDPRVLRPVGRWLRKSRFDEIPQLFNVLRGEMSLIGPRPERPEFVARLSQEITDYPKRLAVAPGITGLAQVWSKYDETIQDVRRKVKYDLLYIRQMCLTADLGILLRTVLVVATGQGAR